MYTKRFNVQVAMRTSSGHLALVVRGDDVSKHVVYADNVDNAALAMALESGAVGWDYVEFSWEEWVSELHSDPTWFMPEADQVFFVSEAQ